MLFPPAFEIQQLRGSSRPCSMAGPMFSPDMAWHSTRYVSNHICHQSKEPSDSMNDGTRLSDIMRPSESSLHHCERLAFPSVEKHLTPDMLGIADRCLEQLDYGHSSKPKKLPRSRSPSRFDNRQITIQSIDQRNITIRSRASAPFEASSGRCLTSEHITGLQELER